MDYSRLYLSAMGDLPVNPIDPEVYRVAIFEGPAKEDDSPVWFACGPNKKLEKIRVRYASERNLDLEEGGDIYLVQDGRLIADVDAQVKDYDMSGDMILVFEAFARSNMPQSLLSSITDKQIKSEPLSESSQQACLASMAEKLSVNAELGPSGAAGPAKSPRFQTPVAKGPFDPSAFSGNLESLQATIQHSTLNSKEKAVESCIPLLKAVNKVMSSQNDNLGLKVWTQRVASLYESYQKPKTFIGLIGQTGAGKSSLANALLDEEQIVSTSGMQACTAAPTQIAFNDISASQYRAEIEFVQPSEWEQELKIFLEDVDSVPDESPRKVSSEISSTVARVHAVHRCLRNGRVTEEDIRQAMTEVEEILGTVDVFESENCKDFNDKLEKYIFTKKKDSDERDESVKSDEEEDDDSDEDDKGSRSDEADEADKVDGADESDGDDESNEGDEGDRNEAQKAEELWPLVKLVRIYTKSPALATGAVLVDLPGLGDSNAARANIARGHMGQCDFLWILSAIKRAVDDETAKKLLGSSLNTQLVMDGSVNKTTFICTSTDDVRVTEFRHLSSLAGLKKKAEKGEQERKKLQTTVKALRRDVNRFTKVEERFDDQISDLEHRISNLKTPTTPSRKRSASPEETESAKKRKTSEASFIVIDDDDDEDEDETVVHRTSHVMNLKQSSKSLDRLDEKVNNLRQRKRDNYLLKKEKRDLLEEKTEELKQLENTVAECREQLISNCIKERNKICKRKIREDYADCIRNLDEREMQRKDPEGFDPCTQIRDYEALGRNLPVFCTSSIAYQKLQGRYVKDRNVIGFRNEEATEIPAVKAHCIRLTESPRDAACQRFLVGFCDLAGSLTLWARTCENLDHVTSEASIKREKLVTSSLDRLEKALKTATLNAITQLQTELDRHIYKSFPIAIEQALEKTTATRQAWEAVRWNTYKATCVRSGVFKTEDWNQALLDPIMTKVARGWSKTFTSLAPNILGDLAKQVTKGMTKFQHEVGEAMDRMPLETGGESLQMQLSNFRLAFEDLCASTTDTLNRSQKDISREFKGLIQNTMEAAYQACHEEHGPGCFKRMKEGMSKHVTEVQGWMFNRSCEKVMAKLSQLIEETEKAMLGQVESRMRFLCNDYKNALGTVSREEDAPLRETRRNVARSVMLILSAIDQIHLTPENEGGGTEIDLTMASA